MDPFDLMNAGVTALAADPGLQAWSRVWFDRALQIYIDPPVEDPPGEEDRDDQVQAPTIQAHSPAKAGDEFKKGVTYTYWLMITLEDAADEVRAEDNVRQPRGTARLTAIVERAVAVIRANKPDSNFVMSYEYETDTVSLYPQHIADVAVTFLEDDHWRPGTL